MKNLRWRRSLTARQTGSPTDRIPLCFLCLFNELMRMLIDRWKAWARRLKLEVYALYLAYRDPRVPWYARAFAACVVAYAFCPIDLIPDPIPVLGYLDDLILVPLGIKAALAMMPPEVIAESRKKAQTLIAQNKPVNRMAAVVIVAIWLLSTVLGIVLLRRLFS
jgi:uncharacterized membrane protein YkvA (DUF1232 family)